MTDELKEYCMDEAGTHEQAHDRERHNPPPPVTDLVTAATATYDAISPIEEKKCNQKLLIVALSVIQSC